MNELIYNFINEIEDINRVKEMSVEEFTKLVKTNELISEKDAHDLIESFKKISSKKNAEDESSDSDQRKKKYREQQRNTNKETAKTKEIVSTEQEKEDNEKSIER